MAAPAHAALYKWVDANGRTVYSDQPPPASVKSEVLNGPPPPANPNAAKELAQKEAEFRKRQSDKADAASKSAKDKALQDRRSAACVEVKRQLTELGDSSMALYRLNEKGERELLNDEGRARERAKLQAYGAQNCGGT